MFVMCFQTALLKISAASLLGLGAAFAQAGDLGEAVYRDNCAACHGETGGGSGIAPPLQNETLWKALGNKAPRYLTAVVANGMGGKINVNGKNYKLVMPPQAHLSGAEMAAVATYVLTKINDTATEANIELAESAKQEPLSRAALHALRAGDIAAAQEKTGLAQN
jgi:mono/diheme cytochrome c family protein